MCAYAFGGFAVRWWLQAGGAAPSPHVPVNADPLDTTGLGDELLTALAKRLRMNSDTKKRAFLVVMTAEG